MSGADIDANVERQTRRLTTIVVADICGYSSLSEKDQNAAIKLSDILYKIFEITTKQHGGRVFNRLGDGFLAEFPSARSGMEAALDFCREVNARNNLAPNSINARVRAGIHVGDVVDRSDGDILGHGVNIAARLQDQAAPGTILASSNIINLLGPEFPHKGQKRGGLNLKNIDETITAYQIDPDKSHKGINLRVPKWLRSKGLMYTVLAGVVLYSAITIQEQRHAELLDQKIDLVMQQNFDTGGSKRSGNVSAPYIRNVLENLAKSNIPSHQASFALLEEGNIGVAIERLEKSLEGLGPESKEATSTMHQIAALSYHYDPQTALANYETLLEINPKDKIAFLWLIRTNNLLVKPQEAIAYYQGLLSTMSLDEGEDLRLQMDMAFSLMVRGEFAAAEDLLKPLESRIISHGDERYFIRWRIELGFISERLGKLTEAEGYVTSAINSLETLGTDSSLPRAYNVMGLIHEKYAAQNIEQKDYHLNAALNFYEQQLATGKTIEKEREIAEAYHFIARIKFELGEVSDAKTAYLNSYRLARAKNYTGSEFKSLLGFAQIDTFQNNKDKACLNIRKAEKLFEKRMGPNLGPTSQIIIEYTGCTFAPKNLG